MTVGMAQRISQSQEQEFVDIFPGTLFVGESFGEVHKKTQVAKRRNKKKHSTHCRECDKLWQCSSRVHWITFGVGTTFSGAAQIAEIEDNCWEFVTFLFGLTLRLC